MSPVFAILGASFGTTASVYWVAAITAVLAATFGLAVGLRRRATPSSFSSGPSNIFASAETPDLGLLSIDPAGRLLGWSPGIGHRLGVSGETSPLPSARWRRKVHESDQSTLSSIIDDATPVRVGKGQFRIEDGDRGWRWMYARCLPDEAGSIQMLLVDLTDRIETEQSQRESDHVHRVAGTVIESLAHSEDVEETATEVLALLGDELELIRLSWFEVDSNSNSVNLLAAWPHDLSERLPEFDLRAEIADEYGPLHDGLPLIGTAEHPRSLVLPILVNGRLAFVLSLETEASDRWPGATLTELSRVSDAFGRRIEQEESAHERQEFAALKGSLERSEVIAQLTSGVAHDFNNLVFAISGRVSLLLRHAEDPTFVEGLEEIRSTVASAGELVKRLLAAQRGDAEPVEIPLATELEKVLRTATRLIPKRIGFHAEIDLGESGDELVITAPPSTLQQLILNLVVNSRDALRAKGRIELSANRINEGLVEIRVDDDGPGIPAADRDRLKAPFVSGDSSDGNGLGLAICSRVVEESGGRFELSASPLGGLGARAVIPVRNATAKVTEAPLIPRSLERTPNSVLVVEDNQVIRDVLVKFFQDAGATVVSRGDALTVETILEEHPEIELLVFDIDLPERTGVECLTSLREAGVRTPCLLVTGGVSDPPELERIAFLRKPFKIDALLSCARSLLGAYPPEEGE
ncbi:MAG: ATP-binding protein [Phycisphaerales bacterium]|jgi:signal transduction histidine kinase|nr:ATP-binding protein [Phycisphaerales bacterium]